MLGVRVDTARGCSGRRRRAVRSDRRLSRAATRRSPRCFAFGSRDGVDRTTLESRAGAGGHALGDLAIGPRGDVFVTDSNDPVLYRLRPGADTLEALRESALSSLQGLAPSPDGRYLYLADYSHGLLRVDLDDGVGDRVSTTRRTRRRSAATASRGIAGRSSPCRTASRPHASCASCSTRRGRESREPNVLDQNWRRSPTSRPSARRRRQFVYVANSQWEKYDPAMRRVASKPLTRPRLFAVPLPR